MTLSKVLPLENTKNMKNFHIYLVFCSLNRTFAAMKRNIVTLAILLLTICNAIYAEDKPAVKNHRFDVMRNLETFSALYKNLDMMYVDSLDPDKTVGIGIKAMLRSLDPYTEYYPASEVKNLKTMLTGKYAGIGALIKHDLRDSCIVIDEPYENMPAATAGLKRGDKIISIDDSLMQGKKVDYVSSHLRGEAGTTFSLKIERDGKIIKKKITRKSIQLPCVPYYGILDKENGIGYLLLTQFTDECSRDIRRALVEMRGEGMKSLIFDLRNNGGGALAEAIKIVNMFVPKGVTIVTTKGKIARSNNEYKAESEPLDTVMPVVVLVNENSASASEITAGALKDFKRATIIGKKTYGKGLVQQPIELPHDASFKVTTSRYYLPAGECVQGIGVKPDIEVSNDSLPNIAAYLCSSGLDSTEVVFHWEVDYIKSHKKIAPATEFHLTDAEWNNLKETIIKSGFKYDRETSKEFDELIKIAKFEGYYDDAKEEFEALKTKLNHNLAKELDNNRSIIQRLVEQDIVTAYYFQKGSVACTLQYDKQVKKAIETLRMKK